MNQLPALPYPRWFLVALCLTGILFVFVPIFSSGLDKMKAGADDFLGLYAGARLVGTSQMYDADTIQRVQLQTAGVTGPSLHYVRFPCFALLIWPLAQLPYPTAHAIWYLLRFAGVAAFVVLWPTSEQSLTLLVCCWSVPLAAGLANGQDAPLLLVWLALAWRFDKSGRPFASGLSLCMCAAKFHLFLLLPALFLFHRQWRVLGGALAGGAGLFALCVVGGGWDWPVRYAKAISDSAIHPNPAVMPNLHGLLTGGPTWLTLSLYALVIVATLFAVTRLTYLEGLAAVLVGSLLISYHAYIADAVGLVAAALLVFEASTVAAFRYAALAVSTPVPWLLLLRRGTSGE